MGDVGEECVGDMGERGGYCMRMKGGKGDRSGCCR